MAYQGVETLRKPKEVIDYYTTYIGVCRPRVLYMTLVKCSFVKNGFIPEDLEDVHTGKYLLNIMQRTCRQICHVC